MRGGGGGTRGRSKNKRKSRKKKNPHKRKKSSKYVKSKNKRKTRKNMHGGGKAYYVVRDNQNNILAEGHSSSISFFKPNRFNAPSISDLEKKIFNDKISGEQKSLKK